MSTTEPGCCEEFARAAGLSRRGFLRGLAVVGGAATVTAVHGSAFTSTAYAAAPVDRVVVLLSMRGACDGLNLVVPHGDPVYYAARPSIAGAVDEAAGQGRLLRPAPRARAAAAVVDQRRRWPPSSAAGLPGAEPLALLGDGGGSEDADPGSDGARRLAQPPHRAATPPRLPIEAIQFGGGVPDRRARRPRAGAGHHRRGLGHPLRLLRTTPRRRCAAASLAQAVGRRARSTRRRAPAPPSRSSTSSQPVPERGQPPRPTARRTPATPTWPGPSPPRPAPSAPTSAPR